MGIRKTNPREEFEKKANPRDSKNTLKKTHTEEIIIALIGQIGTNVGVVREALLKTLQKDYNYECEVIKMSSLIQCEIGMTDEDFKNEIDRIHKCIKGGNELRQHHGAAILSHLAVREIAESRTREADEKDVENQSFRSRRKCYIIDSIKHPAELELLKIIYRDILYTIGIFSPYDLRVKNLKGREIDSVAIHELIDIDSGEDKSFGQKVEAAFVDSDYFLNIESEEKDKIKPKVDRFLNLVFDTKIVTPSIAESAMFKANAAAMNSACLSRQVGAAITDKDGNILSLGWNDVPKAGGGLYLDSDKNDIRCYNKGCCSNDHKKGIVADNIISDLLSEGIINEEKVDVTKSIINRNGIKGLIEFSRSIHAEMHAIIRGAQRTGDKMIEGKLFCTTYPCHNCARHRANAFRDLKFWL